MEFVKSRPGADPIVVEGYFAASVATVFQAWTDPDIVVKWFGMTPNSLHSATIDLRQGGGWWFVKTEDGDSSTGFEGEYLIIEPNRRLVFTWALITATRFSARQADDISRVEITFTARGDGTDVRLVHSAITNENMRHGFGDGWDAAFKTITDLFPAV